MVWTTPFELVDYEFYLPLFMEGLREQEFPYQFLARQVRIEFLLWFYVRRFTTGETHSVYANGFVRAWWS